MKKLYQLAYSFSFLLLPVSVFSQNNALIIDNGGLITLSGGSSATPVYLIIAQPSSSGISRVTSGHIISEGQYNYVLWQGVTNASYVFPLGKDATLTNYIPVTFAATNAGTEDVAISTKATAAADNLPVFDDDAGVAIPNMTGWSGGTATNSVIDRWWHLKVTTVAATPTADVTFSCLGQENTTGGSATFAPQRWKTAATAGWQVPVGSGATIGTTSGTVYTVNTGNITTFSPWVLSKTATPLPIELIDFAGACRDGNAALTWATATETDNDHFNLERSADGINFTQVSQQKGAGNSSSIKKYQSTDYNVGPVNYYRLKQTDVDGKSSYSKVISVNCSGGSNGSSNGNSATLNVFPNPSDGNNIYVKINGLPNEEKVVLVLIDVLGRTVFSKVSISDGAGSILEVVDDSRRLAAGVYTIVGSSSHEVYKEKIIIR